MVHAQEERAALPLLPADSGEQGTRGRVGTAAPPAAELEAAVLEQLRGVLRAPGMVAEVVNRAVQLDPTVD